MNGAWGLAGAPAGARCYEFVDRWLIRAPIERVWAALSPDEQPEGRWSAIEGVVTLRAGDAHGVGRVFRLTIASPFGVRFTLDGRIVRREPPHVLQLETAGELAGEGRIDVAPARRGTTVIITWRAVVRKRWMAALAPVLAPAFRWNHSRLMQRLRAELAALAGGTHESLG